MSVCAKLMEVTERVVRRSSDERSSYLDKIGRLASKRVARAGLDCSNLAHSFAACIETDKKLLSGNKAPNVAVITAYNDMLSAHQPYGGYPDKLRDLARSLGASVQIAGCVPAMCDGITQGYAGMELSLLSRDVIAMSTAIALAHRTFDAVLYLGICDKVVPGLIMGALSFGYLPAIFVPSGPMPSGLGNLEKNRIRELYAAGEITKDEVLSAESAAYHAPGTCTFYGTANSNQLLMEVMGLHLPGVTFLPPNSISREIATKMALERVLELTSIGDEYTPIGKILDERAFINGIVALSATGGSTNHTIHLIAMAKIAGITLDWSDFLDISEIVPLLANVYPTGMADINDFRDAGGIQFLIKELLDANLLHQDVKTVQGDGLSSYRESIVPSVLPQIINKEVLRTVANPFQKTGSFRLLKGNLGRAITRISSVPAGDCAIRAPAVVFNNALDLHKAFKNDQLTGDFIAVIRYQGPRANGMPELHKVITILKVLRGRGQRVALLTDGRLSGASSSILCAIHVTPEAAVSEVLSRIRSGDLIEINALKGTFDVLLNENELYARKIETPVATTSPATSHAGHELFVTLRNSAKPADKGAISLF